jgi:hypothetical protein
MKQIYQVTVLLAFFVAQLISGASFAAQTATEKTIHNTAVEAVIWGMPMVAMDAMRQAYFRDAKAKYNDIVLLAKDWRNQITTPNSSSIYLYLNFNVEKEPVVIDIPAAEGGGVFGSLSNAWQVPMVDFGPKGEDLGKGGKYLILPPGYKGEIPTGYIKVQSSTYNGYSIVRAIPVSQSDKDLKNVMALANRVRIYQLSQAARPPKQRFIDMRDKLFNGIVKFDETYFNHLAALINEEPMPAEDRVIIEKLKGLGIEKGKTFTIGDRKQILSGAVVEAHDFFEKEVADIVPWSPASSWGISNVAAVGIKTGFTFRSEKGIDMKSRGATFFLGCAPPKKLGEATVYLGSYRDAQGQLFEGTNTYQLHVPPKVPAQQFWAVNVYDSDTAGFIWESPRVGIDSYNQKLAKNADGSIDIFFGPKSPMGREQNWIYTAPGKAWFAFFRFYGPTQQAQDRTWVLPNIDKIPSMPQAAQ